MSAAEPFAWLPADLGHCLRAQLDGPMPRGRGELRYRAMPQHLAASQVDGRPHIVFLSYYPYASIIKRAIALRAAHDVHLTLLCCCIREDAEILRFFDEAYEVQDYRELRDILSQARPAALHPTMPHAIFGALAVDVEPPCPIILDIVDSALFQEGDPLHPTSRLEREILVRCQGLVHKLPPEGVARLLEVYRATVPAFQHHSLPWRELFQPTRPEKEDGPHRLVYCGGVMPYHIALATGFGHHVFDPIIDTTLDGRQRLDIHVNQNARRMHWEDHQRYVDMQDSRPGFRFNRGVPFQALPGAIAGAHYGLLYDNLDLTRHQPELFRYNVSTKIFSYMEAGLPILVYEEFEYMRRFILEHGIGLVYPVKRLDTVADILDRADRAALANAVEAFRRENELTPSAEPLLKAFGLSAPADATGLATPNTCATRSCRGHA